MTIPTGNSAIDTIKKLANQQEKGKIQVIVVEQSSYYKNFKVHYINLLLFIFKKYYN